MPRIRTPCRTFSTNDYYNSAGPGDHLLSGSGPASGSMGSLGGSLNGMGDPGGGIEGPNEGLETIYYQWVPFFLLFQVNCE